MIGRNASTRNQEAYHLGLRRASDVLCGFKKYMVKLVSSAHHDAVQQSMRANKIYELYSC